MADIIAVTVGLRTAPQTQYNMHKSAPLIILSLPQTVETCPRTPFLSRRPRRNVVRAGLAIAAATVFLERAAAEQRSIFYTAAAELRATKIYFSEKRRKPGICYVVRAPASSTAALNILGYSTRNRKFTRPEPHF